MLFHPSQGVAELGDDVDEALGHDVAMLFTPARATWGSGTVKWSTVWRRRNLETRLGEHVGLSVLKCKRHQ